jgi:hypothetical protein
MTLLIGHAGVASPIEGRGSQVARCGLTPLIGALVERTEGCISKLVMTVGVENRVLYWRLTAAGA